MTWLSAFAGPALQWAGGFIKQNALPILIVIAAAAVLGIVGDAIKTKRELTAARATIAAQTQTITEQSNTVAHLRTIADERIASAETFGRVAASLDASLAATLQRINDAPPSTTCISTPLARIALDGMRDTRARIAGERLRADNSKGIENRDANPQP